MERLNKAHDFDLIDEKVMSTLKEFQKATVERIDYLYRNGQSRILISDEVGLGKTLVARGAISKIAKMNKDKKDEVKIVYICSNSSIADQNIKKLMISKDVETEDTSRARLSMQHLNIFNIENDAEQNNSYIRLIPLTPETSFRQTNGAGTVEERALMFTILKRIKRFSKRLKALDTALMNDASASWDDRKKYYDSEVKKCDAKSNKEYIKYMIDSVLRELDKNADEAFRLRVETEYKEDLSSCQTYADFVDRMLMRVKKNGYQKSSNNRVIGELRKVFSLVSIDRLNPDFVIMDEFQRFKFLLDGEDDSEENILSKKFFSNPDLKLLMLSATPYKMYSTLDEIEEENGADHFKEFKDVIKFLTVTEENMEKFEVVWKDYSRELKEMNFENNTFIAAKARAQDEMYLHICRTERDSEKRSADIIDDSDVKRPVEVTLGDIESYLDAQNVLDSIPKASNVPIDYIKSCPYIFSFMKNYKLKKYVENYFAENTDKVNSANSKNLWIKRESVNRYEKIPNNNARLDRLMEYTFKNNAENLLWVPPSKPYYNLGGAYENSENFTKTLVFSSWEMVPRMIASLVSYEAERLTVGKLLKNSPDRNAKYFANEEKRYPQRRLRFSVNKSKGVFSGMTIFTLLYPSKFLSDCYNPIDCLNRNLSLEEIEKEVREKIQNKLNKLTGTANDKTDKRWYYLAPLLMDGRGYADTWIRNAKDFENGRTRNEGYKEHVNKLYELHDEYYSHPYSTLGKKPADIADILTLISIASPAVAAKRMYKTYSTASTKANSDMLLQIASQFISLFNTPEAISILDNIYKDEAEDVYWKNVLKYCEQGNIQAVLDEYAFLISNNFDNDENLIKNIHEMLKESVNIKTTTYKADTFKSFKDRISGDDDKKNKKSVPIRTGFAVAFTEGEETESNTNRRKVVRDLFNSPFRPFVLASTSIGQEGLDFHNYCRRIVHWNLPSNPIDLEQREGRINRFECLAIRENISKRYGNIEFKQNIWKEMMNEAELKEDSEGSGLIPFWGLTPSADMVKIERIVPMYPCSKDELQYERLIKILNLYRLTLGQPRQEEWLEYFTKNYDGDLEKVKDNFINLSPYYMKNE